MTDEMKKQQASTDTTIHIVSVVAHVQPEKLDLFSQWLGTQPNFEIHISSAEGKMVLLLESDDHRQINPLLDSVRDQPGVLSVVMVYHEKLSAAELDDVLVEVPVSGDEPQPVKLPGAQ